MAERLLALMGPTASGKSALAEKLADEYDGELISVDSALVYKGLSIGYAPNLIIHITSFISASQSILTPPLISRPMQGLA